MGEIQTPEELVPSRANFDEVWDQSVRVLDAYLKGRAIDPDTRLDLLQDARLKLWSRMDLLDFANLKSWFAYCKRVIDNLIVDNIRNKQPHVVDIDLVEEVAEDSEDFLEAISSALESKQISEVADELWLGKSPPQHELRLLAATLVLVDGRRASSVIRMLNLVSRGLPNDLVLLISNQRTLNETLYRQLHLKSEHLTARILGIQADGLKTVVECISQDRSLHSGTGEWKPVELEIVLRRCCDYQSNGIVERNTVFRESVMLDTLLVRIKQQLPFNNTVMNLNEASKAMSINSDCWGESGLWKRLALQYRCDGLSVADFEDWFTGPAQLAGFYFRPRTVSAWLGNKRLASELAAELRCRGIRIEDAY